MPDGFLPNSATHSFLQDIPAYHDPFQTNRFEEVQ